MNRFAPLVLIAALCLSPLACGRLGNPAVPTPPVAQVPGKPPGGKVEKPTPPFELPVPTPATAAGVRPTDAAAKMPEVARRAASRKDYRTAAAAQQRVVDATKSGRYDLACYLALAKRPDAAIYWLQVAALEEGVDAEHAGSDEDLESLRRDPRWPKLAAFFADCGRYFESSGLTRTELLLPAGYKPGTPIPAVVWMHGLGSNPENFVSPDAQEYADAGFALIGASGTLPRGPRSFVWADDPTKDLERIRAALKEVGDKVTVAPGQVVLFGFSQGAQVGLDLAARHPAEFAGAIALSPGADFRLGTIGDTSLLSKRGFVVSVAAKEHPGNVALAAQDAAWLKKAKARVLYKPYPNATQHSFPADFGERFPEWVRFVLKG